MTDAAGIDWEDAFLNTVYIPDGESFPARWAARAAAFRDRAGGRLDIPYGDSPRARFDLFLPEGRPKGLVVFVHGGFWLETDKSFWSHLGAGARARGWAVALPGYTLAPAARISEITRQIGRAITAAAGLVDGPIRLSGHSAGGHLATRMVCTDTPLAPEIARRVSHVVSLSGLHDLRPLLLHSMNAQLRLDPAEAATESPALLRPLPHVTASAWVGAAERPEFLRQSALLTEAWGRRGLPIRLVAETGRHHFDMFEGLEDPDDPLSRELTGD